MGRLRVAGIGAGGPIARLRVAGIVATGVTSSAPRLRVAGIVAGGEVPGVSRLRVAGITAIGEVPGSPRLRVAGIIATGEIPTPDPTPRLRVAGIIATGLTFAIAPIPDQTEIEPETWVTASAELVGATADSWEWRQISGPGVTLVGTGASRAFISPSAMPPGATIVLGVTAIVAGVSSEEQTVTISVLPQLIWTRVHGGSWVGARVRHNPGVLGGYDVIVGVIQSNIRGAAIDYDLVTDQYNDDRVDMWHWGSSTIVPATEPLNTRDSGTGMGAMNTFVKDYLAGSLAPGRKILIVNAARGGTGLTTPSTNPAGTAFTWNPDGPSDANNLALSTVATLNNIMAALPVGSRIVTYLANHGSTDGSNATPKATFKALLTNWITYLRSETASQDAPYLMMQMRPSLLLETRHNIIDQGQQEIAVELPNVGYAFAPNGVQYNRDDSVHFNALGVRTIGHSLYDEFEAMSL